MTELILGETRLNQIDASTVQIEHRGVLFQYRSAFVARLMNAVSLQQQGKLAPGGPQYCDCFCMTAYLTGAHEELYWPETKEKDLFNGDRFPGIRMEGDLEEAIDLLEYPIAMVSRHHCATLLAGDPDKNLIAHKCGSTDFAFGAYFDFTNYIRQLPAKTVQFFGIPKAGT